jgi:hypothetical protein
MKDRIAPKHGPHPCRDPSPPVHRKTKKCGQSWDFSREGCQKPSQEDDYYLRADRPCSPRATSKQTDRMEPRRCAGHHHSCWLALPCFGMASGSGQPATVGGCNTRTSCLQHHRPVKPSFLLEVGAEARTLPAIVRRQPS